MKLSMSSEKHLEGVHPDLIRIVREAAANAEPEFIVTEGVRTMMRQSELVKAGASKTMKSRHLTGHAVDLAAMIGNEARWDWNLYIILANVMREASVKLGIPVRWGGSWKLLTDLPSPITTKHLSKTFPDGPHFELPIDIYP